MAAPPLSTFILLCIQSRKAVSHKAHCKASYHSTLNSSERLQFSHQQLEWLNTIIYRGSTIVNMDFMLSALTFFGWCWAKQCYLGRPFNWGICWIELDWAARRVSGPGLLSGLLLFCHSQPVAAAKILPTFSHHTAQVRKILLLWATILLWFFVKCQS